MPKTTAQLLEQASACMVAASRMATLAARQRQLEQGLPEQELAIQFTQLGEEGSGDEDLQDLSQLEVLPRQKKKAALLKDRKPKEAQPEPEVQEQLGRGGQEQLRAR